MSQTEPSAPPADSSSILDARLPITRSHLTLFLCTLLHGFTHAYGSMLVPLYYRMVDDLKLPGIGAATLVMTLYGAVYNLGSYGAGILSDRYSRKILLAVGLIGNAAAILGIGLTRSYPMLLVYAVAAGVFGTIFHPAANALVPSHYPKSPGMAIGLLGIGTGLGFFFGPQVAGWRAATATWQLWHIAQWQKPLVELGIFGLIMGVVFVVVAGDPQPRHAQVKRMPLGRRLGGQIAMTAFVLGFRDFAGVAAISLAAIYVRNVFHLNVAQAGLFVGLMMFFSVIFNPLAVFLTPGRRRLPGLSIVLIAGGVIAATAPFWSLHGALLTLCVFETFQMGSYAISDAAILERTDSAVRGRVVGLFLLIAGTAGALGPWVMGAWVDWLGDRARVQSAYIGPFAVIGACMVLASYGPKLIGRIGGPNPTEPPISPLEEISPRTMGSVQ